ncbi:MAG: histone deacetylase [Polyangia bacterium]
MKPRGTWFDALRDRVRTFVPRRSHVPIWYTPEYRLPIPSLEALHGTEPRRADLAVWYLVEERIARDADLRTPRRADYESLARVHDAAYIESLAQADALARIFAVTPGEIVVDEVMRTLRLATGGTIAAAKAARASSGPAFNFFGGFHHAGPALGGGMCALNDVAIALAEVRAEGFTGQVVILDLDAHPPDGLAACLSSDRKVTIGSISGSDWGPLPGHVDETLLVDATDDQYLAALTALLARMPRPELVFVLFGGDVLRGDRLGHLSLTLEGVRERELLVAEWTKGRATVWLPAGGYSERSWKVVVGAYLAVALGSRQPVKDRDPLMSRYAAIARGLSPNRLSGADDVDSMADVEAELFGRPEPRPRFLGYYTNEGMEYALTRFGFFDHLRRLGYSDLRVESYPPDDVGQRGTITGMAGGVRHLLVDLIVSRGVAEGAPSLVVHWLSLRNPRAVFSPDRPALPGQVVPGLGLARDMGQLLGAMAYRLDLPSVSLRPSWFHTAFAARQHFRFIDLARQTRFVDLIGDLRAYPLADITRALAEGRVRLDGEPYAWEPELMIYRPDQPPPDLLATVEHPVFTIVPREPHAS